MTTLEDLKKVTHDSTLRSRSIEAIVHSDRFAKLWNASDDFEKQCAEIAVWQGSKRKLIEWMNKHDSLELGERPFSFLRKAARRLRITNYSRLSKPELIKQILLKENKDA